MVKKYLTVSLTWTMWVVLAKGGGSIKFCSVYVLGLISALPLWVWAVALKPIREVNGSIIVIKILLNLP